MKKNEKFALTDRYKEIVSDLNGFILLDYRGLTVEEITDLRQKLREKGGRLQVIRNRLFAHAINDQPYAEGLKQNLAGPSAILHSTEDIIALAKVLNSFISDHEVVKLKAAVIESEYLDTAQVQTMHKLRSKQDLLAAILGGIQAPARNLLGDIQGVPRKLAGLFRAYEKKLEEAA